MKELSPEIRTKIIDLIGDLESLPTLPHVAAQVMELAMSSKTSVKEISKILESDPALTSKVLKVANSAFYGLKQQVNSLELALVVLGMSEISHLVMSVSVFSAFPDIPGKQTFDRERFWIHSAGCGHFARIIMRKLGSPALSGEVFVGGLLHDIGKVVLDEMAHEVFTDIFTRAQEEDRAIYDVEKEVLGFTHEEVGLVLAEKWNLPPAIQEAISCHHHPEEAEVSPLTVAVVRIADLFCKAKDIGYGGDRKGFVLAEDISWALVQKIKPELADLDVERFTFELDNEIDKVKEFIAITRG